MQNILAVLCLLSMLGYFFMLLVEKKPHWFQTRTTTRLLELEERYDKMKSARNETLHHYYWAQSNGETDKKQRMEKEIIRMDDELTTMRKDYQLLEQGKLVPLKKV